VRVLILVSTERLMYVCDWLSHLDQLEVRQGKLHLPYVDEQMRRNKYGVAVVVAGLWRTEWENECLHKSLIHSYQSVSKRQ